MNQATMRIDNTKPVALHSAKLWKRFVMTFRNIACQNERVLSPCKVNGNER